MNEKEFFLGHFSGLESKIYRVEKPFLSWDSFCLIFFLNTKLLLNFTFLHRTRRRHDNARRALFSARAMEESARVM